MQFNVIVASHRRSGTHFTIDTLFNNFSYFNKSKRKPYLNLDSSEEISVLPNVSTIFKTHSDADLERFASIKVKENFNNAQKVIESSKIIYVFRDGRDVLVSLYNYQKKFDKSLEGVSFSNFIRQNNTYEKHIVSSNISRAAFWAKHVSEWLNRPNILSIEFGDLKHNLPKVISSIESFLEMRANDEIVNVAREEGMPLERKQRIVSSAISFNSGKTGAWVDYFNEKDLEFYNNEIRPYGM